MSKLAEQFEKFVSSILLGFMMIIIVYQIVQLIYNTIENFYFRFRDAGLEYAPEYGRTIAILFFNILLLLEIMETIKVFKHNHVIKVRIILIVCIIAVSRKILALGEHAIDPKSELALAALILALCAGYFLVSRFTKEKIEEETTEKE